MKWTLAVPALVLCTALGAGCAPDADPPPPAADAASRSGAGSNAPLLVYTVNYPLLYFAERIGGRQVQAELPIPEDIDPASW